MENFTIKDFWVPRLNVKPVESKKLIAGWELIDSGLSTFLEAPLALNKDLTSCSDPFRCPLVLVSAPGAVGKSTLAREVSFATGAVYIDLAKAEPVGGNTLSGGLVRSNLYSSWQDESTAVLIDGLDEARLRVSQEALEAFLADVVERASCRNVPTVLFGRTGSIQEAWLVLSDTEIDFAVFEIGYYGAEASVEFAMARLHAESPDNAHVAAERAAIELLLTKLREQTESDGDRFAGYAPVLQAVAERVAKDANPGALVSQIEKGAQPITLQYVVAAILERERGKLSGLPFEDSNLRDQLYNPMEQLDRLVARRYGTAPPDVPAMNANDAQVYDSALETWVSEHPFLNGGGDTPSAVFDAVISAHALHSPQSADAALQTELSRGAAANPFLSEFYSLKSQTDAEESNRVFLRPEHIGIVYASLRSRLSIGDSASLLVDGIEDEDVAEALRAEVEITLARRDMDRLRILDFASEQTGVIIIGTHLEDAEIVVPLSDVEIGPGNEATLVAPVSIQCDKLRITTEKLFVEGPPDKGVLGVYLEANSLENSQLTSVPVVRGNATLAASWDGVKAHPWTSFAAEPTAIDDPRVDEALRRLRKFVISFRSHSRGRLARFKGKIEHSRMTKGVGKAVLDTMVEEGIVMLEGRMYFLDPDRLVEQVGVNYSDCMSRRFGSKATDFANRVLGAHE